MTMSPVHGTCVKIGDAAVLLRGPSGSGKSDLALRLIAAGAMLVADDQVMLLRDGDVVMARAPEQLRGLIEMRGFGIVPYPASAPAPLRVVIDLVPRDQVPRLPEREMTDVLGISLPLFRLHAFDISAPVKVKAAMGLVYAGNDLVE